MPLQNRVTPFGNLVAVAGRGLLMGNRGRLHDAERRIVRYAQGRRWIACLTSFRGRRRTVMSPGLYTELFFLDEAVALAAGHRPCAECRRDDYTRFRAAWARAVSEDTSADGMDMRLDADRRAGPMIKRTYRGAASALPDGAFIDIGGAAWLVWRGGLHAFAPAGYAERREPVQPPAVRARLGPVTYVSEELPQRRNLRAPSTGQMGMVWPVARPVEEVSVLAGGPLRGRPRRTALPCFLRRCRSRLP